MIATAARVLSRCIGLFACCLPLQLTNVAAAQSAFPMGSHRMVLVTPGGDLPFGMVLAGDGKGNLLATLVNGDERIEVPDVENEQQLVLRFPHYDSELRLEVDTGESTITGEWIKRRGTGKPTRMQVVNRTAGPRFDLPVVATATEAEGLSWPNGRYRVNFEKSSDPAVGEFAYRDDASSNCQGTFLTTLGDYRYLAGMSNGRTMKLSCFDGAHAFLFHGERQANDTIKGEFWSSDTWHETWTAVPNENAMLPDGWKLTKWRDGANLGRSKFRDLDGKPHSLSEPPFQGKARVIEVFGSWCPNCHDHGDYMAELYRRYQDRGLQVIGLAFEHDQDFARSVRQVKSFAKRHQTQFPILIGGLSDKAKASESLLLLDQIRSFPTTIFIDKHDQVRGIYQGWSGPATGDAHKRLRERFETLVETMLREV